MKLVFDQRGEIAYLVAPDGTIAREDTVRSLDAAIPGPLADQIETVVITDLLARVGPFIAGVLCGYLQAIGKDFEVIEHNSVAMKVIRPLQRDLVRELVAEADKLSAEQPPQSGTTDAKRVTLSEKRRRAKERADRRKAARGTQQAEKTAGSNPGGKP